LIAYNHGKTYTANYFTEILTDHLNNLWLITTDGIYIISVKEKLFKTYLKGQGLKNTAFANRGIWANDAYLYAFSRTKDYRVNMNSGEKESFYLQPFNGNGPLAIAPSVDSAIWIGGDQQPLMKINPATKAIEHQTPPFKNLIWSILEDKNQRLWLGDYKNGLLYYDQNTMSTAQAYPKLNGFDELKTSSIIHIVQDKQNSNHLWLATQTGWYLLHIKEGVKARYTSKSEQEFHLPADNFNYTYQDSDGVFWLATAYEGVLKVVLDGKQQVQSVEQFSTFNGISSNTINGIFEDEQQRLWISTNNGINCFDKNTKAIKVYIEKDGLPTYEFNRTANFQRADGTIFFGTIDGVVSFHPKDFTTEEAYDIPLMISKVEKYSSKTEQITNITTKILNQQKIIIAPNEPFVALRVTLQDYAESNSAQYYYRIKGFQKEFNLLNSNEITLSGIPYGKYQLEIKAKGKDGIFSTQTISLPVIVLKPFYLQWWFILLAFTTITFGVWQIFQARTRNLQHRKKELEIIVKQRTSQLRTQATQLEQQATELRSLDEVKSRFFANISHELRTPLTLILSPINSVIKRNKLENRDYTSLRIVEQNANKLLKRINEILDLTKLESHKVQLKPQPTPFYKYNKRLVATFESIAHQKGQLLSFYFQLDKEITILLDQDKYEHIFNNYLSNALKYTPKGGNINIRLLEKRIIIDENTAENQIILSVSDDGPGILPEDVTRIFDRYYQSKHHQNKAGSSGIGLALSKEIAQLMNGQVWVESEVGKGSTFYFRMPYQEALGGVSIIQEFSNSKMLTEVDSSNWIQNSPTSKDRTILLVEDNKQLRNYIQLILQEHFNVIATQNGQQALDWLQNEDTIEPDAIISDIMMPVLDGFELLKHLKSSDIYRHIPVLMLTARSSMDDKLKALTIGVDDYILKPFLEEELIIRVNNLIKNLTTKSSITPSPSNKKSFNSEAKPKSTVSASDVKWLQQIEERFRKDISSSKIKVELLADELNMSRSQFQRRIKKITGLSPVQYFREIKLQTARQLLEQGEVQTLNEVAYAIGFDTPQYFSKLYLERFGKKPIEYLK
jgi:signal transduction histidine kinase/DNA-binding response OmpR family regulator/ligand-binding sensor domain-containing protein